MPNPFDNEKIKFPVDCHYKIIAENIPGIDRQIIETLKNHGVNSPLTKSGHSDQGHYISFSADITMHSLESMRLLDRALRSIPGVKMVL